MLEFNTNTLAFMTAALEQACRQLKNDTPAGRQFIATKLKECAKSGQVSMAALTEAAEDAVAQLNGEKKSTGRSGFLDSCFVRARPTVAGDRCGRSLIAAGGRARTIPRSSVQPLQWTGLGPVC